MSENSSFEGQAPHVVGIVVEFQDDVRIEASKDASSAQPSLDEPKHALREVNVKLGLFIMTLFPDSIEEFCEQS